MGFDAERRSALLLPALLFLLPFEPRTPVADLGPLHITLLEAAALLAVLGSLPSRRGPAFDWRGRLPVLLLGAYACAHLVSAAITDVAPARAFRFALRMVAMAVLAAVVAAAPARARERGLLALALGGAVVAVLAVAEAGGLRALDPFLAAFREHAFNVGGEKRASAGSEYPNLAGACVAYALVAGVGWAAARATVRLALVAGLAVLLSAGLLATASRGALLAAGAGLAVLALATREPLARRPSLAALGILGVTSLVFFQGNEVVRLRFAGEAVSSWYGASYEPLEPALSLAPGAGTRTRVRVTNLGKRTWTSDGTFHLSQHWHSASGLVTQDGPRTPLPHDVAPLESVWLDAVVYAPAAPGQYTLLWDMVQEHTAWFSGQGVPPARVAVTVAVPEATPAGLALASSGSARALEIQLESSGWRPTRLQLWSLALGLWRERPLAGVGPDNYRWLYAARAGRGTGDRRIYANNLLLEVLATTGLLGASTLLAALATAAWRSWHAARRTTTGAQAMMAAAWLALVAVVAVHGLVDYVLAFTGHYLLLGFVIGATAALPDDTTEAA